MHIQTHSAITYKVLLSIYKIILNILLVSTEYSLAQFETRETSTSIYGSLHYRDPSLKRSVAEGEFNPKTSVRYASPTFSSNIHPWLNVYFVSSSVH
jgi:hypothetical protein